MDSNNQIPEFFKQKIEESKHLNRRDGKTLCVALHVAQIELSDPNIETNINTASTESQDSLRLKIDSIKNEAILFALRAKIDSIENDAKLSKNRGKKNIK